MYEKVWNSALSNCWSFWPVFLRKHCTNHTISAHCDWSFARQSTSFSLCHCMWNLRILPGNQESYLTNTSLNHSRIFPPVQYFRTTLWCCHLASLASPLGWLVGNNSQVDSSATVDTFHWPFSTNCPIVVSNAVMQNVMTIFSATRIFQNNIILPILFVLASRGHFRTAIGNACITQKIQYFTLKTVKS